MEHDGGTAAFCATAVVATWPKGSFAENIAIDPSGMIFVSLHTDRAVVRIDPDTGEVTPFATFTTPVAGLAFAADGALIVGGGSPGQRPGIIWRVTPGGAVSHMATIAEAAFLNGITPFGPGFLVADSIGGAIYAVDAASGGVTTWLADPALGPVDASGTPGANGIKVFAGHAYISVTGADAILRAELAGTAAGRLTRYAERLRADDFAIDENGDLLIATHPAQSLVRLRADGVRTTLAAAEHGMVGATAVAFGRRDGDRRAVYVTTTGGTMTLPPDKIEVAKLVRVDAGTVGAPLLG